MSSRPRRSAAQRATVAITDMADRDAGTMPSSRARRSADGKGVAQVRDGSSPAAESQHMHLTVKVPSSKLRQATTSSRAYSSGTQVAVSGRDQSEGGDILPNKRRPTRGAKKRYVESESDEEDDEEQDEIQVGEEEEDEEEEEEDEEEDEDMADLGDEDAEGEAEDDDMDVDAEGEDEDLGDEDAEGDVDMDMTPGIAAPTIRISKPATSKGAPGKTKNAPSTKSTGKLPAPHKDLTLMDDDDEELSELGSDVEDEINDTVEVGGQEAAEEDAEGEEVEDDDEDGEGDEVDMDAEGEEIEVADEGEDEDDLDSDEGTPADGSRAGTPDLSKMTRRQRARFEDQPQEYMKLSDEVQAKKVFTAEELSMRRQEMARRRRNLSEKRNEEVKAETINKLLKRQAPKTNKRGHGGDETPDAENQRANPVLIRWISTKDGSRIAVPDEMLEGPVGYVFAGSGRRALSDRKMVEEVS